MNRLHQINQVDADTFNSQYPAGTEVHYQPITGIDEYERTTIRSDAWALGHGEVGVKVVGRSGGVAISNLFVER